MHTVSTHFSRYPDDDGPEQAPCGIWIGDASDLSSDWSRVDCKRCLKWKDTIMATHEAEERAIVQQMGDMADYYAGQQVNRMAEQTDAVPEETPHIIVFDDADRPNEMFSGAGARPAALRRWEQISVSWNAHLFVRVERNSRDDPYPCARLASQVNRIPAGLYAELEALRTLRDATGVYLQGYMRDEIEDEDNCVNVDQHDAACSVKAALDNARALEWKGGDK